MTYPTSTHGFTPRVPVILNVKDLCVSGTPQKLPTASLSHRIHGTGIFTYQFTMKPTIHVGKYTSPCKMSPFKGTNWNSKDHLPTTNFSGNMLIFGGVCLFSWVVLNFGTTVFQATCYFSGDSCWKQTAHPLGHPTVQHIQPFSMTTTCSAKPMDWAWRHASRSLENILWTSESDGTFSNMSLNWTSSI